MIKHLSAFILILLCSIDSYAQIKSEAIGSQVITVSGSERISAIASLNEVTRISSLHEPFLKVIDSVGISGVSVDYQILPETGDIYVSVTGAKSGQKISAFATTSEHTYTFTLTLKDVPAQQILMKNVKALEEERLREQREAEKNSDIKSGLNTDIKPVKPIKGSGFKSEMSSLIKALYFESDIRGFKKSKISKTAKLGEEFSDIKLKGKLHYVSEALEGFVFDVSSKNELTSIIDNQLIESFDPIVWSSTHNFISKGKDARVFIIRKRIQSKTGFLRIKSQYFGSKHTIRGQR